MQKNVDRLFLINSLGKGGAERQASILLKKLPKLRALILEPVVQYDIPEDKIIKISSKRENKICQFIKASLLLFKIKPILVLSFLEFSNYVNVFSKLLFKHQAVISIRNSVDFHVGIKGFINKTLMRILYPHADFVVTNAKESIDDLKKKLKIPDFKIKHVPNALSPAMYRQDEYKSPSDVLQIIVVGRLVEVKNFEIVLTILAQVKKYINAKLVIVGDGHLKNKLILEARKLNLKITLNYEDDDFDCCFAGQVNSPEKLLRESHLFLLTSLSEGLPNTLLEAMANKLPCLSSNCKTGPTEILESINEKYNILLPPPNPNNYSLWVERIIQIYKDKNFDVISRACYQRALEYNEEHIIKKWESIIG